jgi:hypothetical protein
LEGYGEDEERIMESRKASRKSENYQAWAEKWVLGCETHNDFLNLLGQKRIWHLKGKIQNDSWMSELTEISGSLASPKKPTPAEILVSVAARKIEETIRTKNYRLALCGIGVSNHAAWVAYYNLRRQGYPLELVAGIGYYGYSPQPADPLSSICAIFPPAHDFGYFYFTGHFYERRADFQCRHPRRGTGGQIRQR